MQPTAPAAPAPTATNSGQALSNLQSYQQGMQNPQDSLNSAEQSLGVPGAQQNVSGLRQAITNTTNLLNQVAPGVMGRTQNSLVTAAQANKQIQNEQAPISQELNKQQQDYSGANSDLNSLLSRASNQAQLKQQGQTAQEQALKDIYGALSTKEQNAATMQLEQQKLAEQTRQANQSAAISASNKNTATQDAAAKAAEAYAAKFGLKQGSQGQYMYTDPNKVPINMAQYAQAKGLGSGDILNLLQNGTAYDKQAFNSVKNLSGDQLANALNAYKVYGKF